AIRGDLQFEGCTRKGLHNDFKPNRDPHHARIPQAESYRDFALELAVSCAIHLAHASFAKQHGDPYEPSGWPISVIVNHPRFIVHTPRSRNNLRYDPIRGKSGDIEANRAHARITTRYLCVMVMTFSVWTESDQFRE